MQLIRSPLRPEVGSGPTRCAAEGARAQAGDNPWNLFRPALVAPPVAADIATLHELWTVDAVRFVCERPSDLDDYPELSLRVRGALGRRLAERPWPSGPRPPFGVGAYDVLFEPVARLPGGDELPKPMVVRAGIDDGHPMAGHVGRLELSGDLAPLVPYLMLTEAVNTGSHASLGLGWFDLAMFP